MNSTVVFVSDDPGVGGVAKYNHSIKKALVNHGYTVISIHPQNYRDQLSLEQDEKLGIKSFEYSSQNQEELYSYLSELATENKIDLFFCSNSTPLSHLRIKDFAVLFNIPLVIVEGLVEEYLSGKFKDHLGTLEKHYQKSSAVVCVSHQNLALLHRSFNLSRTKGTVIHYGRPESYFQDIDVQKRTQLRQDLGIPEDGFVCFTSARIEKRKGYDYQIQAIQKLRNSDVWNKLYFVWAGGGIFEPQMEADIRDFIATNSLEEKIHLLGQVPDVSEWLNVADLFMLPSRSEGMPLSIMEAMAKGLPVLASAVSGIPEELGNTGYLVPDPALNEDGMVEGIVQAIENMALNPKSAVAMGQQCQKRANALFTEARMVGDTLNLLDKVMGEKRDYISPGLKEVKPDTAFPNLVSGDTNTCRWPYLRREIPHRWYVDQTKPIIGFLSRDEAHILYNTALQFKGENALEIGCWLGWSACHLALAGVKLDVVDPLLSEQDIHQSVYQSLSNAGVIDSVNLVAGYSPQKVDEISDQYQRQWSLIFIDGNHDAPGPLNDAICCEKLAKDDAIVLFHDLSSPDVSQGLDYFRDAGWNTMVYQTMQIMGVAWRGNVTPVMHQPDPDVDWSLPNHLSDYKVCQLDLSIPNDVDPESWAEFQEILPIIRPYTLLSIERLLSIYRLTKKICLSDLPGNFVECGTYKGGAAGLIASIIKKYSRRPRLLYAFDTYEGMPEPTTLDVSKGIPANLTGYGVGTLKAPIAENLKEVCRLLDVADIVKPVKGLFADTIPQYQDEIGTIPFLHADGDWYESTMDIFTLLYKQVDLKGFIQIDDYGHWDGCRQAIYDFEKDNKIKYKIYKIDDTGVWLNNAETKSSTTPLIIIDGVFFQLYKTGISRVWKSLLEHWAKTPLAPHLLVLDRNNTAPQIKGIRYRTIDGYSYHQTESDRQLLEAVCQEEGADLFISTYYSTPVETPSVFMAYDMIPEVMNWGLKEPMWQEKHRAIQQASSYLAISQSTANDLAQFFPEIDESQVNVALCGVSDSFHPSSETEIAHFKAKYGILKPYFVLVGTGAGVQSYKNPKLFFDAFARLCTKLGFEVICTGTSTIDPLFREAAFGAQVHALNLTDEELKHAYSGAVAMVYPSKYEGFGLPIVEAMACGCPVITSPNGSIPEVAGEAVLYIDDSSVDEMVNALCEVQKPTLRQSLTAAGLEQAKKFSWDAMATVVQETLLLATLPFEMKPTTYLIFPDWTVDEDLYGEAIQQVIYTLSQHPQNDQVMLLIENSDMDAEDVNLLLSGIAMNLMMMEDINLEEGIGIAVTGDLVPLQWKALSETITGRIVLDVDNTNKIAEVGGDRLPAYNRESLLQS